MNIKVMIMAAATAIVLTACQSNSYKVKGTAEGLQDGDTLFFTTDLIEGIPADTLIVKNGKFTME